MADIVNSRRLLNLLDKFEQFLAGAYNLELLSLQPLLEPF